MSEQEEAEERLKDGPPSRPCPPARNYDQTAAQIGAETVGNEFLKLGEARASP